jgi:hypothetical protein
MSLYNIVWISILSYVIPLTIILFAHFKWDEYELPSEWYKLLIIFSPLSIIFVALLIAGCYIKDYFEDKNLGDNIEDFFDWIVDNTLGRIKEHIQKRVERKRLLKIREEKIKLGIIKISKDDPYGEEDWD